MGKWESFVGECYLNWRMKIKNSGIFFVLLISIFIVFYAKYDKNISYKFVCIVSSVVSLLWHKH